MNFKTEQKVLQPHSLNVTSEVGRNREAGGALLPNNVPLVDTRTYETSKEHAFSIPEKSTSYKVFTDNNTGETYKVDLDRKNNFTVLKSDSESKQDSIVKGYKLLDEASRVLWSPKKGKDQNRTCKCNKVRIDTDVKLLRDDSGRTFYSGLMQCGSVWNCPVCSRKINEYKATEMRQAFTAALDNKDNIELLTFTFPHSINQSLEVNLKKLSQARQHFWRSAIAKKFRNAGYIGRIDSFEITHGSNGWHPHVHAIVFSNQKTKASHFKDQLLKQWIKSLYKFELANSLELKGIERSLDIRNGSKAGEYVCKFGSDGDSKLTKDGSKNIHWDMADETTKAHIKTGRNGSLTPFDMLRLSSSLTDEKEIKSYRKLFREYSTCMKGKSQIRWSKGLRDYYDVDPSLSDEEIVLLQNETASLKAVITKPEWNTLIDLETNKKHKSNETVRANLRYLASLETKGTLQSSVIARYIYTRTSQTLSFEDYLTEFLERTERTVKHVES